MATFGEWALHIAAVWGLVGSGEKLSEDQEQWKVDWDAFSACLQAGHPLLTDADLPAWEIVEGVRLVAYWKNQAAQPGVGLLPVRDEDDEDDEGEDEPSPAA